MTVSFWAIDFYRFYIIDTVKVDRDSCFHLHFLPNHKGSTKISSV